MPPHKLICVDQTIHLHILELTFELFEQSVLTAPRSEGGVSTPTGASLTVQAPLTGVASQFSARRQLGAVHGSSSVRLAMHQHTRVYIPKNI